MLTNIPITLNPQNLLRVDSYRRPTIYLSGNNSSHTKKNLVEYYIEVLEFFISNDKTQDVLNMFPNFDKQAYNAFIKGENTPKNYIELVEEEILPNVVTEFNKFGGTLSDVSSVRQFFKTLKAIDSYSTTSTRFKERMNTFEDILVEQAVRFNKGISFKSLPTVKGGQNVMDIPHCLTTPRVCCLICV